MKNKVNPSSQCSWLTLIKTSTHATNFMKEMPTINYVTHERDAEAKSMYKWKLHIISNQKILPMQS